MKSEIGADDEYVSIIETLGEPQMHRQQHAMCVKELTRLDDADEELRDAIVDLLKRIEDLERA